MKSKCPRHKRMNRAERLQAAKHWLPKYEGKSIVRGYSKHFGVTKIAIHQAKVGTIIDCCPMPD